MRFLFLIILLFFCGASFPALSQSVNQPIPNAAEETPIVAYPLTMDTAQAVALQKMPGEVLQRREEEAYKLLAYYYTIAQDDGMIAEVGVNAYNGEIVEILVERPGMGGRLPQPNLSKEEAENIALMHLQSQEKRQKKYTVLSHVLAVKDRRLVHIFRIKETFATFEVVVNAYKGQVISAKEVK